MSNMLKTYMWAQLALILALSLATNIFWFPVFFVLYGGVQAVALLYYLTGRSLKDTSHSARWAVYALWLMEVGYTVGLLYVGACVYCEVTGIGILPPDCLRGTSFANPEFAHVIPGIYLNVFYLFLALLRGVVYVTARLVRGE